MALEIERKFLVTESTAWRQAPASTITQGYLSRDPDHTVRVRLEDGQGTLTVKGRTQGISREEREWPLPEQAARALLAACLPSLVDKRRHRIQLGQHLWEVDVFAGDNAGLVVAEVELASADESPELPPWVTVEVSHHSRFQNARLSLEPYCTWPAADRPSALTAPGE